MSNLPPGVTQASIDQAYGYSGFSESWSGSLTCDHEGAKADEWVRIEREPGHDGETYESPELTRLDEAKTDFEDTEVNGLAVFSGGYGVTVQWDCPVCGRHNEDEYDASDFADDSDY